MTTIRPNDLTATFNPAFLTVAREARGLSQAELSTRSGISQGAISKLEHGQTAPQPETLEALAKALRYRLEFFSQPGRPHGLPTTFFRKKKALGATRQKTIAGQVDVLRAQLRHLLRAAKVPECRLPRMRIEDHNGAIGVARALRTALRLHGPIDNMTTLLENVGVLVIPLDFETSMIDALSIVEPGDDLPPVICINTNSSGERLRFSLAHELAHIVLHHHQMVPSTDCESEADELASEFLVPAQDVKPYLGRVTLDSLLQLKPKWKVSAQVLLVCAQRLGRVSDSQYRRLWMQMSSRGFRSGAPEPFPVACEQPTMFFELLKFHTDQLQYSVAGLAKMMMLQDPEEVLQRFPEIAPRGLRVVK